jgi:DNA-binding MarR family transcriptional regulator
MSHTSFIEPLALQIDRLFIAGHRAAGPLAAPIREELGIPHFGVLIDLRKLLLAPSGVTLEQAHVMERYSDPTGIVATLEEHVRQGLIRQQGSAYLPTERGRDVLLRLTERLQRATISLWANREQDVTEAVELATDVVNRGVETLAPTDYPAFTVERQGFVPDGAGPAFTLWTLLSTLRYLRSDAHALAWCEVGLDVRGAVLLTALWTHPEPQTAATLLSVRPQLSEAEVNASLASLADRGWVRRSGAGWELTEEGRQNRGQIEAATNAYNAPPFAALAPEQQERFLSILEALPADSHTA